MLATSQTRMATNAPAEITRNFTKSTLGVA
jgi:hypothetical protein